MNKSTTGFLTKPYIILRGATSQVTEVVAGQRSLRGLGRNPWRTEGGAHTDSHASIEPAEVEAAKLVSLRFLYRPGGI